jgi:ADP-ribose pyrophosphatase
MAQPSDPNHPHHHASLTETRIDGGLVYEGNFLKINRDTVRLPDGKETTREYVVHAGAVMVIPLFDDGRVLLERQYRYPICQVMTEFPANCAKRRDTSRVITRFSRVFIRSFPIRPNSSTSSSRAA